MNLKYCQGIILEPSIYLIFMEITNKYQYKSDKSDKNNTKSSSNINNLNIISYFITVKYILCFFPND